MKNNFMAINLHNIGKKKKTRKRLGRGNASGHGTYSGKGQKGQRARSGGKGGLKLFGFRRTLLNTPKMKGMKPHEDTREVLLSTLEKSFADGDKITPAILLEKRIIDSLSDKVKIIGGAKKPFGKKVELSGCLVSAGAKEAIEKAGGSITAPAGKEEKSQ